MGISGQRNCSSRLWSLLKSPKQARTPNNGQSWMKSPRLLLKMSDLYSSAEHLSYSRLSVKYISETALPELYKTGTEHVSCKLKEVQAISFTVTFWPYDTIRYESRCQSENIMTRTSLATMTLVRANITLWFEIVFTNVNFLLGLMEPDLWTMKTALREDETLWCVDNEFLVSLPSKTLKFLHAAVGKLLIQPRDWLKHWCSYLLTF